MISIFIDQHDVMFEIYKKKYVEVHRVILKRELTSGTHFRHCEVSSNEEIIDRMESFIIDLVESFFAEEDHYADMIAFKRIFSRIDVKALIAE